jgi:hypothetical protein
MYYIYKTRSQFNNFFSSYCLSIQNSQHVSEMSFVWTWARTDALDHKHLHTAVGNVLKGIKLRCRNFCSFLIKAEYIKVFTRLYR